MGKRGVKKKETTKKKHYTMQMTWLLGATVPAKKVHFSLNGSELRGFPIKARSGQRSILYANPLAPKSSMSFLPLSCCHFWGPKRTHRLSVKLGRLLSNIHSCQRHRGVFMHVYRTITSNHVWIETLLWLYFISLNVTFLKVDIYKTSLSFLRLLLVTKNDSRALLADNDKNLKALYEIM